MDDCSIPMSMNLQYGLELEKLKKLAYELVKTNIVDDDESLEIDPRKQDLKSDAKSNQTTCESNGSFGT